MLTTGQIVDVLDRWAPSRLAEDWDNVGLLVGNPDAKVSKVMTCLTITPDSAAEAVERGAELIVAHHPLPFRPLKRLTTETTAGRLLLELTAAKISIYSAHTAFDSASSGINERLAAGLGLIDVAPLILCPDESNQQPLGAGRYGAVDQETTLEQLAQRVRQFLSVKGLHRVGEPDAQVAQVGIACGSGGSLLEAAIGAGCDTLVTGEASFHTCLEAEATGVNLLLPGHFATERFAMESLAHRLSAEFPSADIWASQRERDPLVWM